MSSDRYPLRAMEEVGVRLYDCIHKTPSAQETGYPYIAIPNVQDGRLDLSSVRLISPDDLNEWTRKTKPQAGDVLVTRRGRIGDTAVIPAGLECAMGQNLVLLRSDGSAVDQRFLRWAAQGPLWESEVARYQNVGAVFYSLNCRDIPKIRIPVPPLDDQIAIASVLEAIDDRIELNQRMARTLDAMVQVAHDEMVSRGPWPKRPVGDSVEVLGGSTPSTKADEYWAEDGGHCWATPKDLSNLDVPVLTDTTRHITDAGLARISSGLLPRGTVLLSSRAPVGYVAVADRPTAVNQGFIAMVCDQGLPNLYVMCWARSNLETIKQHAGGTTFQEISKRTFRPLPIPTPPAPQLASFMEMVQPLFDRMVAAVKESATLADLRDTLLPKLISGELRVGQGERIAEDVA